MKRRLKKSSDGKKSEKETGKENAEPEVTIKRQLEEQRLVKINIPEVFKVWAFLLWFLCFVFHVGKGKQNTLIDKFVSADVSLCRFLIQNFQNILWNPHGDYFLFRLFRMKYSHLFTPPSG